jgi:hypothetical protein
MCWFQKEFCLPMFFPQRNFLSEVKCKSQILKITWKYKIGDKIAKAHYTTDYTALMTLHNSDAIALEKDVQKIAKEWAPEIAEFLLIAKPFIFLTTWDILLAI